MARFEIINNDKYAKIYSVKVKVADYDASATGLVSNGVVGKVVTRLEDNVYQLEKLAAQTDKVFFLASPEVAADQSSFSKNALKTYLNDVTDVLDAVELRVDRKFAISEDGIVGTIVGGVGYVYAKTGTDKLQYKATKPTFATDGAVLVAEIEKVVPATQGMFIAVGGTNIAMQYNIVRCRVIA